MQAWHHGEVCAVEKVARFVQVSHEHTVYIYSSFHKYTFSTLRCDRISINIDMFCLSDEEKERTTLYTLVQMTSGFLILTMIGVMIAMASMLYTSVQLEVYSPL